MNYKPTVVGHIHMRNRSRASTLLCNRWAPIVASAFLVSIANGEPIPVAQDQQLVIVGVTVIDGTGRPQQPDMTVRVGGGRVQSVTPGHTGISRKIREIDGRGKFLLPGFVEGNGHQRSKAAMATARTHCWPKGKGPDKH
jgi:adenine deaminase